MNDNSKDFNLVRRFYQVEQALIHCNPNVYDISCTQRQIMIKFR